MSINTSRITRSFSPNEVQDLGTAFGTVDQIFDFHQGVSPQDLPRLLRIGTDSRRFVQEIKIAADDFPWLLPGFLPKPDFDAEFDLYFQLVDMEAYLESLLSRTHQTRLIAGHHLMRDSLDIYGSMQHAVRRGVSGVTPYLSAAEARFNYPGNSSTDSESGGGPTADQGGDPPAGPSNGSSSGNGNDSPTSPNSTPTSGGGTSDPNQSGGGTGADADPNNPMGSGQGS